RKRMSGARAFYINVSRAKDHVQIVTDDRAGWMETLGVRKNGPATAHDALMPEPERGQARRIWAMGQPVGKTAIGRAFLNGNGLSGAPVTARIIPPTRKYPEPHLALPAWDANGKTAGVTLVPLHHEKGTITPGPVRQLATEGAQAAMLQKSRSGEVLLVTDLAQGLTAAREKPEAGILLVHGAQPPSAQLLKVAGGRYELMSRPDATMLNLIRAELQEMLKVVPPAALYRDERQQLRDALDALEKNTVLPSVKADEEAASDLTSEGLKKAVQNVATARDPVKLPQEESVMEKITLSSALAVRISELMKQKLPQLPGEPVRDYAALIRQASGALSETTSAPGDAALRAVLSALSGSGLPAGIQVPVSAEQEGAVSATVVRQVREELDRASPASRDRQPAVTPAVLANTARELERQTQLSLPPEPRGREPDRELPAPEITRHIQKER
ncbi:conjugative transfer relaxase/helicase TraI domain-containing protein, partial [Pantoea dispersa]|uniref:conjugative transfer relaxase/helicase TraI domain-containing protein n=1 Tax=Pantoea dispersa TaxID=59814 RepID=UPI0039BEC6CA